jgi:hypothetical protein
MAGPFHIRDTELAVQKEVTYATSPGALAGGDFFKHHYITGLKRDISRYDRDQDADFQQASVLAFQLGRKKSSWSIPMDIAPAGAGTPTAPDIDLLLEAGMGAKHAATAHTTTGTGSTGVTLELASGGGAASGIAVGDLIAVDVSATFGYEVRRVTAISTDTVTVNAAFSANPASGRTVKVGVTYKMQASPIISLYFWKFNGDDLRYVMPGSIVKEIALNIDFAQRAPVLGGTFTIEGRNEATQSGTSRPTPVTAGVPLVPSEGKLFLGAVKHPVVTAGLNINGSLMLRENESSSLEPSGAKRTENNSRYNVTQNLTFLSRTTSPDSKAVYDAGSSLAVQDAIMQLGVSPGNIVAWATPRYVPEISDQEIEGEVGYTATGRCYGTSGNDEVYLAFI